MPQSLPGPQNCWQWLDSLQEFELSSGHRSHMASTVPSHSNSPEHLNKVRCKLSIICKSNRKCHKFLPCLRSNAIFEWTVPYIPDYKPGQCNTVILAPHIIPHSISTFLQSNPNQKLTFLTQANTTFLH